MKLRFHYFLEAGAFYYWMDIQRPANNNGDIYAASWTGRYRRLVAIETKKRFWRLRQ